MMSNHKRKVVSAWIGVGVLGGFGFLCFDAADEVSSSFMSFALEGLGAFLFMICGSCITEFSTENSDE